MNRQFQPEDRQLALELAHCAEQAAEAVHCVILERKEVTQIQNAIDGGNWTSMWTTLQEFLDRYKLLIRASSPITNITLVRLAPDQVEAMTTNDLIVQLKNLVGFIFVYHALHGAARNSFRQCFWKLASGLAND